MKAMRHPSHRMPRRAMVALMASVLGVLGLVSGVMPRAVDASADPAPTTIVSRTGLAWTGEDATSGTSVLTYDNGGCQGIDANGFCTGGAWPKISGAHWIWRSQNVTADEAVNGTPWVTFTDSFSVVASGGQTELVIAADNQYQASIDGQPNLTGGSLNVDHYPLSLSAGTHTLTVAVRGDASVGADPYSNPTGVAYKVSTSYHSTLALAVRPAHVVYGRPTTMTVTLGSGSSNRAVDVYRTIPGSHRSLWRTVTVPASGTLTLELRPGANAMFTATYAGDDLWSPAKASVASVTVKAAWHMRTIGGYGNRGAYRLYHYRTSCAAPNYRGCPWTMFRLLPNHPRFRVTVVFQYRAHGRWNALGHAMLWKLDKTGRIGPLWWYRDRDAIGARIRVRCLFPGDATHVSAWSAWSYWMLTR